jgi:hypothetical protein
MSATATPDRQDDRDKQLLRRAAEGDRRAWELLVDQYARLVWSITVHFNLVESDAADVAQTTWLRLLEQIGRIQHPDRVGSWLAATARNECLRKITAVDVPGEVVRDSPLLLLWCQLKILAGSSASYAEVHRLTNLTVFLAGQKRRSLGNEWRSHLCGETGRGLARNDQIRAARGFLWAAVRYRLQDAADLAWRPADAVLRSRTLSNLTVWFPVRDLRSLLRGM